MQKVISLVICLFVVLCVPQFGNALSLDELLIKKGVITAAEASQASAGADTKIWWDQATHFDFPDQGFTFNIKTLLQSTYTYIDSDVKDISSFDVRRARFTIFGDAVNGLFSYYFQPDFVDNENQDLTKFLTNDSYSTALQTMYLTWHINDWLDARMGQYKTLLSRQYNTTDGYAQFVERALPSDFLFLNRQQGITFSGAFFDGMFNAWAGIYNGRSIEGTGSLSDDTFVQTSEEGPNRGGIDTNHTGLLAVRFNPVGEMNAYQEGDYDHTEELALSFGAAFGFTQGHISSDGVDEVDFDSQSASVDANLKYQGWSLHAEGYFGEDDVEVTNDPLLDAALEKAEPTGFYVQGGYFIMPKELEVVARYAVVDCDADVDPAAGTVSISVICPLGAAAGVDDIDEVSAGLNYYFWGHNVKTHLGYTRYTRNFEDGGEDLEDDLYRLQVQFMG